MQPAADLRSILAGYQLKIYNEKYQAEGHTLLINDSLRNPSRVELNEWRAFASTRLGWHTLTRHL